MEIMPWSAVAKQWSWTGNLLGKQDGCGFEHPLPILLGDLRMCGLTEPLTVFKQLRRKHAVAVSCLVIQCTKDRVGLGHLTKLTRYESYCTAAFCWYALVCELVNELFQGQSGGKEFVTIVKNVTKGFCIFILPSRGTPVLQPLTYWV